MLKSIEGIYVNGEVRLTEPAPNGVEGKVIITFLESPAVDLATRGITPEAAAELKQRLSTFEEDWDRPEMDVYDQL